MRTLGPSRRADLQGRSKVLDPTELDIAHSWVPRSWVLVSWISHTAGSH